MTPALPPVDRLLLEVGLRLVPAADRTEWSRYWQAELWHRRHPRSHTVSGAVELYPGLLRDAFWLRTESHRRALSGTALLCLMLLATLVLVAALPLLALLGGPRMLFAYIVANDARFLCEGTLVTLVSLITAARLLAPGSSAGRFSQIRGNLFQAAKILLVLVIASLLSSDLTLPFHASYPFTAEIVQPLVFVLLALLALRWSFSDSQGRCQHCQRALETPRRVGLPSRNFLDSNGTELLCGAGHGLLSIPEMETSWCGSSRWIAAPAL